MNQLMNDRPGDRYPVCADATTMAERELTAFFAAMTELFGPELAELSAEDWLRELNALHALPSSTHEWRRITLNVSAGIASRVSTSSMSATSQPA